jgi:hypothetical protein
MTKFALAALTAAPLLWASSANALLITVNAGASPAFPPTFETIGTGDGSITVPSTAVGSWSVEANAEGTPPLTPGSLDSNTIVVQTTGPGTLIVWVTEQGLAAPLGNVAFTSGLTTDILEGAITSANLATFISTTNGVSSQRDAFGPRLFHRDRDADAYHHRSDGRWSLLVAGSVHDRGNGNGQRKPDDRSHLSSSST